MNRQKIGRLGEDAAAEYLKRDGYLILERNFRCRPGEIDIIAKRGDTISFIEVKTRTSDLFGMPAESVGPEKQRHIRKAADAYMKYRNIYSFKTRFDVLEIMINHIRDAF